MTSIMRRSNRKLNSYRVCIHNITRIKHSSFMLQMIRYSLIPYFLFLFERFQGNYEKGTVEPRYPNVSNPVDIPINTESSGISNLKKKNAI